MRVVRVLSGIMCYFNNSLIELYLILIIVTIIVIIMAILFILNYTFRSILALW